MKKRIFTKEHKKKLSISLKKGFKEGRVAWNKGKKDIIMNIQKIRK